MRLAAVLSKLTDETIPEPDGSGQPMAEIYASCKSLTILVVIVVDAVGVSGLLSSESVQSFTQLLLGQVS